MFFWVEMKRKKKTLDKCFFLFSNQVTKDVFFPSWKLKRFSPVRLAKKALEILRK